MNRASGRGSTRSLPEKGGPAPGSMSRALPCLGLGLLLVFGPGFSAADSTKQPCETCQRIVQRFHKGLEDTAKKNFGGGNTAWEEKTLSKYETSEIRLVEIIENLCDSSDFECNNMVEEHEEQIEKWWFKMKKKHSDLLKWFCIETIEVCCPPGTYGPDCLACLGGSERPCNGNGICKGDGTRSGDGSCSCKTEYTGDFCLDCADGYYSTEKNDTHALCTACHPACKTCTGATNNDCKDCNEGWIKNDDLCADVDECAVEESPCTENKYCLNSEGSYECKDCDRSCAGCTGDGPDKCKDCSSGYTLEEEKCTDVDECAVEDSPCEENEYCFNSEGSYKCKVCDESCTGCTGDGPDECKDCTSGYALEEEKCTDINECASAVPVCLRENEDCVNTPGSYKCICSEGYEAKDGHCVQKEPEDILEAEDQSDEALQAEFGESNIKHEDL